MKTMLTISVDWQTLKEFKKLCDDKQLRYSQEIDKFIKYFVENNGEVSLDKEETIQ